MEFEECFLLSCNFSGLKLKEGNFAKSRVKECDFKETLLKGANFKGADLEGTVFHECDLTAADFREAIKYDIDPQANQISKGKYSSPEVLSLLKGLSRQH